MIITSPELLKKKLAKKQWVAAHMAKADKLAESAIAHFKQAQAILNPPAEEVAE